jgi:hypothetical protein
MLTEWLINANTKEEAKEKPHHTSPVKSNLKKRKLVNPETIVISLNSRIDHKMSHLMMLH